MESNRPQIGTFTGTGNEASVMCGRVMFSRGFTGASAAIDTACSSSLVAASFALDAARRSFDGLGRVDRAPRTAHAFAAGASLMLTPDMHLTLGGAGMLSHFGRCMVRSIQKFFTHSPVSTFERVPFQLTGDLFFLALRHWTRARTGTCAGKRARASSSRAATRTREKKTKIL